MNKSPWSVSVYYKLFFVFGITFLVIIFILSTGLQGFLKTDGPRRLLQKSATVWNKQVGKPIDMNKVHQIEHANGVKGVVEGNSIAWEFQDPLLDVADQSGAIITVFAICMGIVLLSSMLVRRILLPIKKLTETVNHYRDGHKEIRAQVISKDELGELSFSFNSMADQIDRQMNALKQLAVGISHEVRSPLARLLLLAEKVDDSNTRESIRNDLHEIDAITEAVLEREKLNAGISELRLEPVDLSALLEELAACYSQSSHTVKISGSKHVVAQVDLRRMEMCLKNLLDNCFKYADADGEVSINVSMEGSSVKILIRDYGAKGSRAPNQKGFGLGLKLCESIIRAHGGTLQSNAIADGTEVTISLAG